jgi:hypothetical protein
VRTQIAFGANHLDLAEETVSASLGWHPAGSAFGLEGGIGALVHGRLGDTDLDPGAAFSATGSWLPLPETTSRPFILVAVTASVLTVPHLTAVDFRGSAVVGKTFFDRLTAYVAGRVFGGPVNFDPETATGADTHHYAVGAGASLRLPSAIDVFAEFSPVGEQSLNVGAGLRF